MKLGVACSSRDELRDCVAGCKRYLNALQDSVCCTKYDSPKLCLTLCAVEQVDGEWKVAIAKHHNVKAALRRASGSGL